MVLIERHVSFVLGTYQAFLIEYDTNIRLVKVGKPFINNFAQLNLLRHGPYSQI
ncbi:hypothetical protein D3C81_2075630 [compost metagenome]